MNLKALIPIAKYIPSRVAEPAAQYLVRVAEKNAAATAAKTAAETVAETGAKVAAETGAKVTAETGARVAAETGAKIAGETGAKVAGEVGETVGKVGGHVAADTARAGAQTAAAIAPVLNEILQAASKNPLGAKIVGLVTKYGSLSTVVIAAYQWLFGGDTEEAKREGRDEVLNRLGGAAGVILNGNKDLKTPDGALRVLDQALRAAAANPGAPMDPRAKAIIDLVKAYEGEGMPSDGSPRMYNPADGRQDRMMSMMFDELMRLKANNPYLMPTPIASAPMPQSLNYPSAPVGTVAQPSSPSASAGTAYGPALPGTVDWR